MSNKFYLTSLIIFLVAINFVSAAPVISEQWNYISETSAFVYWRTDIQSQSYVEFGTTTSYGQRTPTQGNNWLTNKGYFTHAHRLTGLQPNTTYNYKMISTDSTGTTTSQNYTFTTKTQNYPNRIEIPGNLSGPPYILNQNNAVYVLTEDITVPQTAIEITVSNITLDLDGHTIIYN